MCHGKLINYDSINDHNHFEFVQWILNAFSFVSYLGSLFGRSVCWLVWFGMLLCGMLLQTWQNVGCAIRVRKYCCCLGSFFLISTIVQTLRRKNIFQVSIFLWLVKLVIHTSICAFFFPQCKLKRNFYYISSSVVLLF